MVIVHDFDKYKYYDKQKKVDIIKYSNGVKKKHNLMGVLSIYHVDCMMVINYLMIL